MSETADQPAPAAPDISIRVRPPSPRRLSRKVLLTGALVAASITAFALAYGLGGDRRNEARPAQAAMAAGAPPESIRNADSQYEPRTLAPPSDNMWAEPPPSTQTELVSPEAGSLRAGAGRQETEAAPNPETQARASSIVFEAREPPDVSPPGNGVRLEAQLQPPRSHYELVAGSVIPAALLTALNSDHPGPVIAQVTSNVYDSASGAFLLIPHGARLIGEYRAAPAYGEQRLSLTWTRLILPNGVSITLGAMPGSDVSGAAGVPGRSDNHLGRLALAIGLSAVVSVVAANAENDGRDSAHQSVGDAAAAQAAQTGGRIVDRELEVHPTISVRAGAPVRVLVTRDIQLRPYRTR